jgi:hypothetical protein
VNRRLPVTFAALGAGKLDPVHVKIIEEVTRILPDQDAAVADEKLAAAAPSRTYGELRRAAARLVLRLDPEAVRRRKEQARRGARVRSFREESGNAGITGREMPSVEVLALMQHVEERARALREAGVPGTWEELKVRATLDLLQERDSRPLGVPAASGGTGSAPDPAPAPARGEGPGIGAMITITVPHTALDGDAGPPGGGGRVRDPGSRRYPGPGGRGRGAPGHPVVRDRPRPRRDRGRARLRGRTPPVAAGIP